MKKLLYFLLSLIFLVLAAYFAVINMPQANTKNKKAEVSIMAKQLYKTYSEDEVKANKNYTGKVIEVVGTVLNISEDQQGATVIIMDSGDEMAGVMCTLQDKPKKLPAAGDNITIKGQCNGLLMDVVLNKCIIVKS